MQKKLLAVAVAALLAGAVPASADDSFLAEQKPTEYLAKDRLIGAKIAGDDGKIIGDIEDLIINNDNQVVGVIIGVGGFLGAGEKRVAVPMADLSIEATDGKMNVHLPKATKDVLNAAPEYKRINPPKGWIQRALEKGKELTDKSTATAKEAYDAAKEKAGPALDKAKQAAEDAYNKAKDAAHPAPAPSGEEPKK